MDDPQQGLADTLLEDCDVLIWWGHVRQAEISTRTARRIVDRIEAGKLKFLVLHSGHWSTPFMLAMQERTKQDALAGLSAADIATHQINIWSHHPGAVATMVRIIVSDDCQNQSWTPGVSQSTTFAKTQNPLGTSRLSIFGDMKQVLHVPAKQDGAS